MTNIDLFYIIAPALAVGLLIAIVNSLLGVKVLSKGIIFIDLAIAQVAGMGLIIGNTLFHHDIIIAQSCALFCALIASFFFYLIEKKSPSLQEAIIGSVFVLTASVTILLVANHPHGGDEIKNLLSGQILFSSFTDLAIHGPVYAAAIILWFLKPNLREGLLFYIIFAIVITSAVQIAGLYVVFASLILPAIAAKDKKNGNVIATCCALLAMTLGIILTILLDLPAGPLIVISYFITTIAFKIFNVSLTSVYSKSNIN